MEKEKLNKEIEKFFNVDGFSFSHYSGKTKDEIINEMSIYYQELFYQNEELKRIQQELEKSNAQYFDLFHHAPIGYALYHQDYRLIKTNQSFNKMVGYEERDIRNLSITQFIHSDSQDSFYLYIRQLLKTGKENEIFLIIRGKEDLYIKMTSNILVFENVVWIRSALMDITKEKKQQDKINYLNCYDTLTGLYNWSFFKEECQRLDTLDNLPLSYVIGDVNGLKLVNDAFGHAFGDKLLKEISKVLKENFRSHDIIARMGGDEFVILLPRTSYQETELIIKRILSVCKEKTSPPMILSISFGWETKNSISEDLQYIIKTADDRMYQCKLFESLSNRGKTIETIIQTLYETHAREENHSRRVSLISEAIGQSMGMGDREIKELSMAGLLHDIGKIAIGTEILDKKEILTARERVIIRRHPEIGYRILCSAQSFAELAQYVLYHHEQWDGTGYPKGLKGREIPLPSRIIAVADAYDAMTSERSYRLPLSKEAAITEIGLLAGKQFDPEIAQVFTAMTW